MLPIAKMIYRLAIVKSVRRPQILGDLVRPNFGSVVIPFALYAVWIIRVYDREESIGAPRGREVHAGTSI